MIESEHRRNIHRMIDLSHMNIDGKGMLRLQIRLFIGQFRRVVVNDVGVVKNV